ncbi:hypothetical protein BJ741DRAFT_707218 [Chytriomyces cf. hyalinus JEL632]|nr:hypothetical protein BJ741DRAFT_707218 [Chytriomyces cf. hyalinus JEL632]
MDIAPNTTGPGPPIQQPLPVSKKRRLSLAMKPTANTNPASSSLQPGAKHQKPITSFFSAPPSIQSQPKDASDLSSMLPRAPLSVVRGNNNSTSSVSSKNPSTSTTRVLPTSFTSIPSRVSQSFSVLRDSSNSTHATLSKTTKKSNIPIIVNDSDDDFEDAPFISNSRIQQPKAILTAMKRQREKEDSDEESGEGLNEPDEYLGVHLTDLGKKNWAKLLNPKSGRIVEPPKKNCLNCGELVDWRTKGCIYKVNGKYYNQSYCAGACIATMYYLESIDDCVDVLAKKARAKDLENGFEVTCTPEESREIFRAAWAKHNGQCSCCKVKLLSIGNGANTISKQRNKPGLSYHDPLQDLDFLCIPCNRLRDEFSAREVQDVFKKIHEAVQKPAVRRQPTTSEIAHIKKMRGSYAREDFEIKDVVKRNDWSISPTANTTAFAVDLIDIAKKAGCIGTHSGITGTFTKEKHIFKMGFDRIHSTTEDADGKRIKWLHSKGNLKLELTCINVARNSLTVDEFSVWIDRIKQGLFR